MKSLLQKEWKEQRFLFCVFTGLLIITRLLISAAFRPSGSGKFSPPLSLVEENAFYFTLFLAGYLVLSFFYSLLLGISQTDDTFSLRQVKLVLRRAAGDCLSFRPRLIFDLVLLLAFLSVSHILFFVPMDVARWFIHMKPGHIAYVGIVTLPFLLLYVCTFLLVTRARRTTTNRKPVS